MSKEENNSKSEEVEDKEKRFSQQKGEQSEGGAGNAEQTGESENFSEEKEDSELEEKIEDSEEEIDTEQFQEFISQPQFESSSPSLEKLNVQENLWTRQETSGFEDDKEKINYLSAQGTDLKYAHMDTPSPKRVSFEQIQKTPEQILDEQRETHKRTFMQDPMLKASEEHDYEPNPNDFFEKKEFQNIRKDYDTR